MNNTCEYCAHPYDMEGVYPDEPHHGEDVTCDECGAEYYREYGGNMITLNKQAYENHPNMETFYKPLIK